MKKKCLSVLLATVMLLTMLPLGALSISAATSGTTGDCTWELDGTHLTISGNGAMKDYTMGYPYIPWGTNITSVTISHGVTAIGEYAFYNCTQLTTIDIATSVEVIGAYAFRDCTSLTSVTLPSSLMDVDGDAFSGCASLTSIDISASNNYYSTVNGVLFNKDKTALIQYPDAKSGAYTISNSVTNIGVRAFSGCAYLTSITIPNSVTNIDVAAFAACTGLTSVTIPNSVTSINDYTFSGCSGLISVTIPNSVTSIGKNAFYHCSNLTSVTIPDNVTTIGDWAFSACTALTTVSIGNHVTTIGYRAFVGCTGLASLTLPDSVTTINEYAFYGCDALTSVTIPKNVKTIGMVAFGDCTALTSLKASANNPYYSSVNGVLFNKDQTTLVQYPAGKSGSYAIPDGVTTIGDGAFYNCDKLTGVTIPNTAEVIGEMAFSSCGELWSITIPDSVTTIKYEAFRACYNLHFNTIPDSIIYIGDGAFYDTKDYHDSANWENDALYLGNHMIVCSSSKSGSFSVRAGTLTIAEEAFTLCDITSVNIPSSVKSIGASAFRLCLNIKSFVVAYNNPYYASSDGVLFNKDKTTLVRYPAGKTSKSYYFPYTVTTIGDMAFYQCYDLTSVTFPNGLITIGEQAFNNCDSLSSVVIPDSVTTMKDWAFANCHGLTKVTLGKGITHIGELAFTCCQSLTSITIPNGVVSIGYHAFNGCTALTSVTIPESVSFIGEEAFLNCKALTSVTIPQNITSIEKGTFSGCPSLSSVTIPATVTAIADSAFNNCVNLTTVYYGGTEEEKNTMSVGDSNSYLMNADWYCYGLEYRIWNNQVYISGCVPAIVPADLVIPNIIESYPVTGIDYEAFYGCNTLVSVTIPDNVTTIGTRAFASCRSLTEVTIGKGVTSVGYYTFDYDYRLSSIIVAEGNKRYSSVDGVLFNKDKTTLVRYPAGKTGAYIIPDSVTTIEERAFYNCSGLTEVTIPDSVTTIGSNAFYYCKDLTEVTIPDSVTTIGNYAFYYCSSLTDVYYGGSEGDKANISIGSSNDYLLNATWHYADDPISDTVDHSVMDTTNGNGLAFRFELTAKGVVKDNKNVVDLTNATINYLGKDCKLIAMGAVVTNDAAIGEDSLTLEDVNDFNVQNVPTVYLQEADEDSCAFATRIINIPDSAIERTVYARPYFIVEVDGEQIVIYGDVDSAFCAEYL